MAERRMFAKTIVDSDAFLEMPMSARLLYYDLSMRADDDGFVNSPIKIMRMVGATKDDLNILILRRFILSFDNGIIVIKHWRIHNYIRKDTYNKTPYQDEFKKLKIDENKAYFLDKNNHENIAVDEPSTQVRLGKVSIGKDSIDNSCCYKDISLNIISDFENENSETNNNDNLPINLIEILENEISRPLTPFEMECLKDFQDKYSDEIIKFAIKQMILNGKRNIGYLRSILENYRASGFLTVDDIQQYEDYRQKKKKENAYGFKTLVLPDYQKEIEHDESLDIIDKSDLKERIKKLT